jgi:hypothetical protein
MEVAPNWLNTAVGTSAVTFTNSWSVAGSSPGFTVGLPPEALSRSTAQAAIINATPIIRTAEYRYFRILVFIIFRFLGIDNFHSYSI